LKKCKKIISLLLALSLVLTLFVPASALNDKVRVRLEGLGLMEGHADGSFGEDEELTRAQMAMITARMLQVDGAVGGENPYSDVANDHWAKDVIATLSHMGVVNGTGDGTFNPEASVNFYEATKMIVSALGYDIKAEDMGGYPLGYVAQAGTLGLYKNVSAKEGTITRGDVAEMLYQALDVKPVEEMINGNYKQSEETLYEILLDEDDMMQLTGILKETAYSSLNAAEPTLKEGYVRLGETKLLCDKNLEDYLGSKLTAYIYLDDETDEYKIKSFALSKNNEVIEADAEDVVFNGDAVTVYTPDGSDDERYTFSGNVQTVYNGRLADIPEGERAIYYGNYRLIDNNGNGDIDVLFINEAESFIVEKVNTVTSTVYFKNRATLQGRNAVVLDKDDKDVQINLVNNDGEEIEVADIQAGSGLSVFASLDLSLMKVVISEDTVSGVITECSDEGVRIDGKLYELVKKPNGENYFAPEAGDEATYVLDTYGNIIDAGTAIKSSYLYAYVIDARHESGISGKLILQTVTGLSPKKEVVIKHDEEIISYYFQNDMIKTYTCADSVYYNSLNERINCSDIDPDDIKGSLIAFNINGDGVIKELHTRKVSETIPGSYAFNADIISFGGENVLRGYATNENTVFICVPENGSDEDYYVQVKITDEAGANMVEGAVFFPDAAYEDPESEPVDILVIKAAMDASKVPTIQTSNDLCMVGSISQTRGTLFGDEDSIVYEMELLNGTNKVTEVTHSSGAAFNVAKSLRKGDLIRYVKDGFGRVVNISKVVSIQGLGDRFSGDVYIGTGVEKGLYGLALHSVPGVFDYFSNQMVDKLKLTYDMNGESESSEYRLFHEDQPTVYKYDRTGGWISPGYIEDIRTFNQVGDGADRILAIVENNDITALVIITD